VHNQPLVYIIVLTYHSREVIRPCLVSLGSLTYSNYEIVVVDNDSTDGTAEILQNEFPELTMIRSGGNLGYTGGNNRGIEHAIERGADYVLILNPDTVVADPKFLTKMIAYVEANPLVGIAGPRVFLREEGIVQNTVLFPPGLLRNIVNWVLFRINPKSFELSGDEVVETQVLNGVCILIRVNCLREIGLFDEKIFMYIEDADLDYRARREGWRVRYLPIDSIIHRQKRDGYHMTGPVSFLLKRNSVYYLCKIGKRLDAWGYAISSLTLLIIRGILTLDRNKLRDYTQFCKRLIAAYRWILTNRDSRRAPDESFGPPFAKL
jgi:GT2 family glycosyltransferase